MIGLKALFNRRAASALILGLMLSLTASSNLAAQGTDPATQRVSSLSDALLDTMKQSYFTKKYSVQFINENGKLSEPFYFDVSFGKAARLSAKATLVQNYYQMRIAEAQRTLLEETVAGYERSVQLTTNQYNAGVVARVDVIEAETQLNAARAQLPCVHPENPEIAGVRIVQIAEPWQGVGSVSQHGWLGRHGFSVARARRAD